MTDIRNAMSARRAHRVLLAMGVLLGLLMIGSAPARAETGTKALVLNSSVSGGASSAEAAAAIADGFTVTVVSDATWGSMTAAQFADYQLVIVGDPTCSSLAAVVSQNAGPLADAVMARAGGNTKAGNRVLIGTDPEYHFAQGGSKLIKTGIDFAGGQDGATNLYLDFTCGDGDYDGDGVPDAQAKLLPKLTIDAAGTWAQNQVPPCGGSVSLISNAAAFATLHTSDLQAWSCSVHESFPRFPTDWTALAIAIDTPTKPTCGKDVDSGATTCGEAYVLIAGSGIVVVAPNLSLAPATGSGPVGTSHTVTATVTKPDGTPLSGVVVSFVVTGANAGAVGACVPASCASDAAGQVKFTYTGAAAGSDTINASITVGGSRQTATAAMTWVAGSLPRVSIGDVTVKEGNTGVAPPTPATFVLSLSAAAAGPVAVTYATANATAIAPGDYQAATGTVTFPAGTTSKTMTVNVVGDLIDEPTETFHVVLSAPSGATIADGDGLGTIIDDDRSGAFSCRAVAVRERGVETLISNNPDKPCKDDARSEVNLPLLGGAFSAKALNSATNQTPDDVINTAPAVGDRGEADASAANVVLLAGGKTVRADEVTSHAEARCGSPLGGVPLLNGASRVTNLTVNSTPVTLGAGSANIDVKEGVLHINSTVRTATTITQRGIWFQSAISPAYDIVVSEAKADFSGNPCR